MDSWPRLLSRLRASIGARAHHAALVQGAAQTLMGRSLEAARADEFARRVARDPAEMRAIVAEMLSSTEARQHIALPLLLDAPAINASTRFISMGTHCFTASLLQRWGLRSWSGPFDWLFASPSMLTHVLRDDFATLLNRDQYRPTPIEQRVNPEVNRVDHAYYRVQHGVAFVFNHHDVHLDEGHAYLTRCVERLRAQLSAETHKTFLMFRRADRTQPGEILALRRELAARTRNFRLCVFAVDSGPVEPLPRVEVMHADETLSLWRYHPASTWHPLYFESPLDEATALRLASPSPMP